MTFDYVELVTGSIFNRNHIVTVDQAKVSVDKRECYRSLFRFNEELATHVAKTGSTAEYKGLHTSDCLLFDFDNEQDLSAVQNEVLSFIQSSEANYDIPPEYWRIAFSGTKGFHVVLPITVCGEITPAVDFYETYKRVCWELAKGFKYLDRGLYTMNRVVRMLNSINDKSGLHKIPLTYTELSALTIAQIQEKAQNEREIEGLPLREINPIPFLVREQQKPHSQPMTPVSIDLLPDEGSASLFRPAQHGERNQRSIVLSGILRSRGFSEEDALLLLRAWNGSNSDPLSDKELTATIKGAYKRYGGSNLPNIRAATDNTSIEGYLLSDAEKEFEINIDTPENEKVKMGLPTLDKKIRAFTSGMVCSVIAKSSNGKSSFAQSVLLKHARSSRRPVIFFSLEMPLSLVYERVLQSELGWTGYDVVQAYKNNRAKIKERAVIIQKDLNNLITCTQSAITMDDVADKVRDVEQKMGQHVSLIAIDYLSLLSGKGNTIFERTTLNAIAMKQLAKNLHVPVIFLAQTTKTKSLHDELDENAGKDAASILEASDFQITLWRDKEDENEMELNEWIDFTLCLTKNRSGQQGSKIKVRMNKATLHWEETPYTQQGIDQ